MNDPRPFADRCASTLQTLLDAVAAARPIMERRVLFCGWDSRVVDEAVREAEGLLEEYFNERKK